MEQAGSSSFLERFCPGKRSQPLDHPLGREPTPLILGDHFAEVLLPSHLCACVPFQTGNKGASVLVYQGIHGLASSQFRHFWSYASAGLGADRRRLSEKMTANFEVSACALLAKLRGILCPPSSAFS